MGQVRSRCEITKNGNPVNWTSVSFRREADAVAPGWSIEIAGPEQILTTDQFTIKYGVGADLETVVENATPTTISEDDPLNEPTRTVSGQSEATDLLDYCIPTSLVFANSVWITEVLPGAAVIDGILKWSETIRVYHPRLPGTDVKSDEFEVITDCYSHHDIGHWLASQLGMKLVVNTPDLELLDTCTFEAGMTWFDAIKRNFQIWSPDIRVVGDEIQILDVGGEDSALPGAQTMTFTNDAIEVVSRSDTTQGSRDALDHVIVEGRAKRFTILEWPEEESWEILDPPTNTLSSDEVKDYEDRYGNITGCRQMGHFTGEFGEDEDEFTVEYLGTISHHEEYHVEESEDRTKKRKIIAKEIITQSLEDGTDISKKTTTYYYDNDFRPSGESIKYEGLVQMPGDSEKSWQTLGWHHVRISRFKGSNRIALTKEMEEKLVMYDFDEENNLKLNPYPLPDLARLDKSRTAISKDSDTTFDTLEMTTNMKVTKVSRVDFETLKQDISDYDVLSGTVKFHTQFLENPLRDELDQTNFNRPFRRSFFNGSGQTIGSYTCYHSPRTIKHDDITTEAQMQLIADRAFARYGDQNMKLELTTPLPLPLRAVGYSVILPAMEYDVFGATTTIPGGTYVLDAMDVSISNNGSGNAYAFEVETNLTVRSSF